MDLITVDEVPAVAVEGSSGVSLRNLIPASSASKGSIDLLELTPGAELGKTGWEPEEVLYLVEGSATLLGGDDGQTISAGDAVYLPATAANGIRNPGGTVAKLLRISVPGAVGEQGDDPRAAQVVPAGSVAEERYDDEDLGFRGVGASWFVTAETVGSENLVFAPNSFTAGGAHELHRHDIADEFIYLLSGHGHHLTPDGEIEVRAGQLTFMPAREWHGYRSAGDTPSRGAFGYLGAGSLEQGGYEVYPSER